MPKSDKAEGVGNRLTKASEMEWMEGREKRFLSRECLNQFRKVEDEGMQHQ